MVCHVGAKLILVDTQKDSLEMDYDQLEAAITEKTKVVIPIDLAGIPCDYEKIYSIVEKKKAMFHPTNKIQEAIGRVIVMADAAHAFGANVRQLSGVVKDGVTLPQSSLPRFDGEQLLCLLHRSVFQIQKRCGSGIVAGVKPQDLHHGSLPPLLPFPHGNMRQERR